jgi:hypothetical protein
MTFAVAQGETSSEGSHSLTIDLNIITFPKTAGKESRSGYMVSVINTNASWHHTVIRHCQIWRESLSRKGQCFETVRAVRMSVLHYKLHNIFDVDSSEMLSSLSIIHKVDKVFSLKLEFYIHRNIYTNFPASKTW